MHLRTTSVKRGNKTYRYAQLVQGYRRKSDGMRLQHVLLNLGRLTDEELAKWRTALKAMREGKPLVIPTGTEEAALPPAPLANLRYLDVAVLLEMWKRWDLSALLDELLPCGAAEVRPSAVTAALAVQRCVSPCPKSSSPEWFGNSALPELLGIAPRRFNNTRLHRVLDGLDEVGPALMQRLPERYVERDGKFVVMFVDVTDSWFVGRGPKEAQAGKTKEGRFERKVNIVLLCNQKGYPLRWEVLPGHRHDSRSIIGVFDTIREREWASDVPVVCDRALGCTAHLRKLARTGVHFLTALTRNEFSAYGFDSLPFAALADLEPRAGEKPHPEDVARAAELVEAGMKKVDDKLFVFDLGLVTYAGDRIEETNAKPINGDIDDAGIAAPPRADRTVEAMRLGRKLQEVISEGRASGYRSASKMLGLTPRQGDTRYRLTALADDLQEVVLRGGATGLSLTELVKIARLEDKEQQRAEFARRVEEVTSRGGPRPRRPGRKVANQTKVPEQPLRVRAVAYFNPERFVQVRLNARAALEEVERFIASLNRTLAKPQSTRDAPSILAVVHGKLAKLEVLGAFDVSVRTVAINDRSRFQVDVALKPDEWARRRRYDGFSILAGHPDLEHAAAELCRFYREKDAVEKDFRIIKSTIELRPFHHRLFAKIRAHVTICMLALLLERTLRDRLSAGGVVVSSADALSTLATCHLNLYAKTEHQPPKYRLTQVTEPQHKLLRVLRLQRLGDEQDLRITHR